LVLTRNIWTGQAGEDASSTAVLGRTLQASLWPTNALNVSGIPSRMGSLRPAAVRVTGTALIGSPYVRSIVPPWWTPSVPMP
jgi:hypothetical protein